MVAKLKGIVKSFNSTKGYGFIDDLEGNDCFFHYHSLNIDGYKTIAPGTTVSFVKEASEKGYRATDIDIIPE